MRRERWEEGDGRNEREGNMGGERGRNEMGGDRGKRNGKERKNIGYGGRRKNR